MPDGHEIFTPIQDIKVDFKIVRMGGDNRRFKEGDTIWSYGESIIDKDEQTIESYTVPVFIDATGLVINRSINLRDGKTIEVPFYAISHSGQEIPSENLHAICSMCQHEDSKLTRCYIGVDCIFTKNGHCLCAPKCATENEKRDKRHNRSFGFWPQTIY